MKAIPIFRVKGKSSWFIKAPGVVGIHTVLNQLAAISTIEIRNEDAVVYGIHPIKISEIERPEGTGVVILLPKLHSKLTFITMVLFLVSKGKGEQEVSSMKPWKQEVWRMHFSCHIGVWGQTHKSSDFIFFI